eukprot:COSAG02_NODE_3850_length_6147_cov_7.419478_9_plen_63_part_00
MVSFAADATCLSPRHLHGIVCGCDSVRLAYIYARRARTIRRCNVLQKVYTGTPVRVPSAAHF